MLCKIADLFTEIPEEGGIAPLLEEYKTDEKQRADIVISAEAYNYKRCSGLSDFEAAYIEAGMQFNYWLLSFAGMMLHSSAISVGGKAYLFSGPSGVGKSTHTALWKSAFPSARIINDDKPALRRIDGVWYAYGTPWSGKFDINRNARVPVAGIAILNRGTNNTIVPYLGFQAISAILDQMIRHAGEEYRTNILELMDKLLSDIPVWKLTCNMNPDAATVAYCAMSGRNEGL